MSRKLKQVVLSEPHRTLEGVDCFRVEKLTDTIDYSIGSLIPKKEVGILCENGAWKVVIIPIPKK